jgi:hypothetical protein
MYSLFITYCFCGIIHAAATTNPPRLYRPEFGDINPKIKTPEEIKADKKRKKLADQKETQGTRELGNTKLSAETINSLKEKYPTIAKSFHDSMTIQKAMSIVVNSDLDETEKDKFFYKLNDSLNLEDILKIDSIVKEYRLQEQKAFSSLLSKEKKVFLDSEARKSKKAMEEGRKEGRRDRKNPDKVREDFFNEPISDPTATREISSKYYQGSPELYKPGVTTVSDLLKQIVKKTHDPKYDKNLLRNPVETVHRTMHNAFISDPRKTAKYFNDKNPIIDENIINNRIEKLEKEHAEEMSKKFDQAKQEALTLSRDATRSHGEM